VQYTPLIPVKKEDWVIINTPFRYMHITFTLHVTRTAPIYPQFDTNKKCLQMQAFFIGSTDM